MPNFLVRNYSRCSYEIPSIPEYMRAINKYGIILVLVGTLALIIVIFLFLDTLRHIIHHSSSRVKTHTAFVLAVYPVTCLVSLFAILVPRAHLLSEAITQGMFMAGMYQLFCLFVSYCGGDAGLVQKVNPNRLSVKVGPCCCWPCCSLLPTIQVNKKTVKYLRLLVLQLPLVQGLVYFVLLVMWAERESLYQINYMYLQPIIIISILFGVWGMGMTINILKESLGDKFFLIGKFFVLQMVLIFAKAQGLATRALVWFDRLPCNPPISPQVYANLIHNILMILEMVLLGFLARKLYKKRVPDIDFFNIKSTVGNVMPGNINNNTISDQISRTNKNDKGYNNKGYDVEV